MDIIERDVLLTSKEDGQLTMDFPITRLGNIEDTADVKEAPVPDDYIPIMDSADDGQMKKLPWSAAAAQFAEANHTHEEISNGIDTHNSSSEAHGDIREELEGKQDKLTGTQGQLVGFDANGNAVPQAAPDTGVTTFKGRTGAVTPQSGDYTAAQVGARPDTWTPTAADVGASPIGHKHTKSEITDFPASMPANDVPDWAKEASKPSYTASEVGALPITGGTLAGNLRINGSGNYGTKINLGDDDCVHIYEKANDNLEIKASSIKFVTSDNPSGVDIDDLKTSVSNGKSAIASAITDKGISTSTTADFSTMASNIAKISSGPSSDMASLEIENCTSNPLYVLLSRIRTIDNKEHLVSIFDKVEAFTSLTLQFEPYSYIAVFYGDPTGTTLPGAIGGSSEIKKSGFLNYSGKQVMVLTPKNIVAGRSYSLLIDNFPMDYA